MGTQVRRSDFGSFAVKISNLNQICSATFNLRWRELRSRLEGNVSSLKLRAFVERFKIAEQKALRPETLVTGSCAPLRTYRDRAEFCLKKFKSGLFLMWVALKVTSLTDKASWFKGTASLLASFPSGSIITKLYSPGGFAFGRRQKLLPLKTSVEKNSKT